jgi:hypothetical protein
MTPDQKEDARITEILAAQLRNESALRRECRSARLERPSFSDALPDECHQSSRGPVCPN